MFGRCGGMPQQFSTMTTQAEIPAITSATAATEIISVVSPGQS